MDQIVVATKNKGKAAEFHSFFQEYGIHAKSLLDQPEPLPDVEETGMTFWENAALKAEEIASFINQPVISDDSGLEITALDGKPGIYSARYAGKDKNDEANIDKVLQELDDVPMEKRDARFVCVLAIAIPGEKTVFNNGYCEGKIAFTPKGSNGFGYDPIFIPIGYTETLAELPSPVKNKISHRHQAFSEAELWIQAFKRS